MIDEKCPCDDCPHTDICDSWEARFCCTLRRWLENDEPYKTVVCNVNKGGCGACGGYYPNKSKAIEAWNRRAGE